jgi:hypothetical protein
MDAGESCRERGWSETVGCRWPARKEQYCFSFIQNYLNEFELIRWKGRLPIQKKIQIKYRFEGFEERNNVLHRNFFRFEVEFEWKFREASTFEIQ